MYKLTAITFTDINQAYKFIAQENHKWVVVGGKTHQIIRNKNTTTITVVFAKAITQTLTVSEFLNNYLKVVKSKPKQQFLRLLFERYYPYPKIKNSDEMVDFRVPTTEKKIKEFLRDKVDDLSSKIPNETDKEAWHTSLFMIKVSMETEGVKFWRAAARVMEWLEKQEQKYVPV